MIPTYEQALELLKVYCVWPHIIAHCKKVAKVASFLAKNLNKNGYKLSISLVETGSLLHDIAKPYGIENHIDHSTEGARWLEKLGYPEVAEIVKYHVFLPEDAIKIGEKEIVNYADKRVKDEKVVTLEERFEYIFKRYGHDKIRKDLLNRLYHQSKVLEELIFKDLPFSPQSLSRILEGDLE